MFKFPLIVAAVLTLTISIANAEINAGRPAGCLLVVRGKEAIRGECTFTPTDKDGSFTISAYNGKYFAYVTMIKKGLAAGYWNEDPYATHAHSPLGELRQEKACWVNDLASVCAY